jgi:hypothetical protein
VRRRADHVDPPGLKLDEEQDVERLEPDRLDREEVGREDPRRLRPEELGPRWAGPARSRVKAVAEQGRPNRRRGDPDPELHQLPADPLVAPPRVLPAEADDEVADLGLDRRPAGMSTLLVCPLPPHELPVPAEQGLRPDDERRPSIPGDRPARSRQQEPVEAVERRALHLPLQHLHLVPEHQQLDLSLFGRASSGAKDAANEEVHEREEHGTPFRSKGAHATDAADPGSGKLNPSR